MLIRPNQLAFPRSDLEFPPHCANTSPNQLACSPTPETSVLVLIGQLATSLAIGRLRALDRWPVLAHDRSFNFLRERVFIARWTGLVVTPTPRPRPPPPPLRALASNRRCFTASSRSIRNSAIYGGLASSSCSSTTTSLRLHACMCV